MPANFARGMAGSALAGRKYTEAQKRALMEAIHETARVKAYFTTQEIWPEAFKRNVPRTKAIGAYMSQAKRAGWITQSGEDRICDAGGEGDHAQNLRVWKSLIYNPNGGANGANQAG